MFSVESLRMSSVESLRMSEESTPSGGGSSVESRSSARSGMRNTRAVAEHVGGPT
jgi:hypothetical protein